MLAVILAANRSTPSTLERPPSVSQRLRGAKDDEFAAAEALAGGRALEFGRRRTRRRRAWARTGASISGARCGRT